MNQEELNIYINRSNKTKGPSGQEFGDVLICISDINPTNNRDIFYNTFYGADLILNEHYYVLDIIIETGQFFIIDTELKGMKIALGIDDWNKFISLQEYREKCLTKLIEE